MPKQKRPTFNVGDIVTWKSQAAGTWLKKTGTVIEVVAPRQRPQMPGWGISYRNHESYVVEVPGKTSRAKPKRYWPVTSKLKRAAGRRAKKWTSETTAAEILEDIGELGAAQQATPSAEPAQEAAEPTLPYSDVALYFGNLARSPEAPPGKGA